MKGGGGGAESPKRRTCRTSKTDKQKTKINKKIILLGCAILWYSLDACKKFLILGI